MAFGYSPSATSKISVKISSSYTEIKGAEAIPEYGAEKATYDTTSIADAAKTFGDDLPDYGELTLTGIWDSMDAGQAHLAASATTAGVVDDFQVDWAKKGSATTAAKDVFNGIVLSFKKSGAKGGPQKFTSRIKLTGAVTATAMA